MRVLALLSLAAVGAAHMQLSNPPPLRSKFNPYTTSVDWDMVSPLASDGSNYPCKGYLSLLGTAQGAAVTTYSAGSSYSATIVGGTLHNGGSCQFSLSIDGGNSFHVLKSYIGNCPSADGATYEFSIPSGTASAQNAIFAWTWFNNLGNREMYMNCAVVNIDGDGGSGGITGRPTIFQANVGNGCRTQEATDVMFPNPGPVAQVNDAAAVMPVGSSCESGSGATGSWDSSGSSTYTTPPPSPPTTQPPPSTPTTDHRPDGEPCTRGTQGGEWDPRYNGENGCQCGTSDSPKPGEDVYTPGNTWPDCYWWNAASITHPDLAMRLVLVSMAALLVAL